MSEYIKNLTLNNVKQDVALEAFEKGLKDTIDKFSKGLWEETLPYVSSLVKLNEYRIITISSQPRSTLLHKNGWIEIRRSFLWFYIEINETSKSLLGRLIHNNNIYLTFYNSEDKFTYGNYPVYDCTEQIGIDDLGNYKNCACVGYPHSTYLDPLTYKILEERIITDNEFPFLEPDFKNCFYVGVTTINGRCAIDEVLDIMNEILKK